MEIREDNQAAIAIAENPVSHGRTKHIDLKYHFIRDQVEEGTVHLKYCPSEKMTADILTKGIPKPQFIKLRDQMGVCSKEGKDKQSELGQVEEEC